MPVSKVANAIAYLAFLLREQEANFGKTKLVKLLYLADVEYFRRWSRQLTNIDWLFYHYGPYSSAIDEALKELNFDITEEKFVTRKGFTAQVITVPEYLYVQADAQLSEREKRVLNKVLEEWGMEDLNPLLSHVYFETEPMLQAERGERLDFSKIVARPLRKPTLGDVLPSDSARKFHERFQAAKAASTPKRIGPVSPAPRDDAVFRRFIQRIREEEQYSVPEGAVEIDEAAKDDLSRDGGR